MNVVRCPCGASALREFRYGAQNYCCSDCLSEAVFDGEAERVAALLRPLVQKHGLAWVRERYATGTAVWDLLASEVDA
jgi:hypothetical protein